MAASEEFEAQLEALAQIDSLQKEWDQVLQIRASNLPAGIAEHHKTKSAEKLKLKPDVKKSTAFVKKIKANINNEGIQQCIRDTESVNLTQFIEEIVNAIVATNYKAADASHMVRLCVALHQKYPEFAAPLVSNLKAALLSPPTEGDAEAGKRKRIQIRFLVEIYQIGIVYEDTFFCSLLRNLLGRDNKRSSAVDLQGLSTFAKYGCEVLMGFRPRKLVDLAAKAGKNVQELPQKILTAPAVAAELNALVADTYQQLCKDLVKAHKDFYTKEARMEKDKLIHGSLTEQKQAEWDTVKRVYEKLLAIVTALSECTGEAIPVLQVEKEQADGSGGLSVWEGSAARSKADEDAQATADGGYFGDAETRSFYEDLPDLVSLVPLAVLGLTAEQVAVLREQWALEKSAMPTAMEAEAEFDVPMDGPEESEEDTTAAAAEEDASATTAATSESAATAEGAADGSSAAATSTAGEESKSSKLLSLLNDKLPECTSKAKADDFSVAFCYVATKNARKRLVQALLKIPRSRLELAPYYARIAATLKRLYPDITKPLLDGMQKEFFGMMKTKNQYYIENKLKNVRCQGEFIKFRVAPPIVAFRMFRSLLSDLTPHNVQLLASMLEACGRYLYLLPYTQDRMSAVLDTMLRQRRARHLDLHQQTVLEAAYFAVKPPERAVKSTKAPLSNVQKYARFLIQEKLDDQSTSVEQVIKSLRRLPWSSTSEQIALHVVKASLKLARAKYVSVPNLADCLSGLGRYQPNVAVALVDRILEELQRSLDSPYKREIQRILGYVRLLGELYNFMVVTSQLMFQVLYFLISFGHERPLEALLESTDSSNPFIATAAAIGCLPVQGTAAAPAAGNSIKTIVFDPTIRSDIDLPNDLFRAQIICEILNTCGMYYVRGKLRDKLRRFLVFFQYYLLTKQFVPLHVEFSILDTFDFLEEQAQEAEQEAARKAAKIVKGQKARSAASVAVPLATVFARFDSFDAAKIEVDRYLTDEATVAATARANLLAKQQSKAATATSAASIATADATGTSAVEGNGGNERDEEGDEEEDDDFEENRRSSRGKAATARADGGEDNEDDADGDSDDNNEADDDDEEDGDESDDRSDEEGDDDDEEDEEEEAERRAQQEAEEELAAEREAARMMEKLRVAEEDDEFEKAFKNVMQDSITSVARKPTNDAIRMAIPAVLPKPKNTFRSMICADDDDDAAANATSAGYGSSHYSNPPRRAVVPFKLLSRDGKGRVETRQLLVPEESRMAVKLVQAEQERKAEKQRLKEQILQLDKLSADAEAAENMQQYQSSTAGGALLRPGQAYNKSRSYSRSSAAIRAEETRKPADALNLDEFLAETNAAELRKTLSAKK